MTGPAPTKPAAKRVAELHVFIANAVRATHADMLLDDRFDEPIVAQVKRGFPTACWVYDASTGHRVFVGDGCLDRAKPGLSDEHRKQYVGKFLHHERAHAILTERRRDLVEKWLAEAKVPFGLYNWTEDARVESKYVADSEGAFSFEWAAYEPVEASCLATPEAQRTASSVVLCAFFNLIQTEGAVSLVRDLYPASCADAVNDAAAFYADAIAAQSSKGAIDVAAAMLQKYPDMQPPSGRCGLALGMSMQGPEGAAALAEFTQDDPSSEVKNASAGTNETGQEPSFTGTALLSKSAIHQLDPSRIARLADRLCELSVRNSPTREATRTPGGRVSMRHALRGDARWYSPETAPTPRRVRRIVLVGDVSGSMDGSPVEALAYLIAALSEAQSRGAVTGDVILSTTDRARRGASVWMRKPLPWTLDEASRVATHDCEGLASTLRANTGSLEQADLVLVQTDGDIGGPRIPHAEFRKRGMTVVGGYVNSDCMDQEHVIQNMLMHFDRIIVRNTVEAMVDALVLQPLR